MVERVSPYLSKGFEPLRTECDRAFLDIEGELPADLDGVLYRIGPSPQFAPRGAYNPLNGDGMVQAFRIGGGRVSYRNRWVRTERWKLDHAAGRSLFGTSGDPSDRDASVMGIPTDGVANTNLVWHGGRLLALEEGHGPIEIDPASLETIGRWSFQGRLPRNMTAHPKIDPETGEMLFFANFPAGRLSGEIALYGADRGGGLAWTRATEGPFPGLVHDFAVTRDFLILPFCPVTVSLRRAMAGGPLIAWEPGLGLHVGVLRRDDDGPARWWTGPAAMAWHVMNAFNEGGRIVVDVCAQEAPMFPLADGAAPDEARATQRLTRWELDWDRPGTLESRELWRPASEYPRIDERRTGLAYRYGWLACRGGPGTGDLFHRGLARFDHVSGRADVWEAGPRLAVAEPVFAPRKGAAAEGDGYILTNVFDEARNASHLAIFRAEAVHDGPIARAHLDHRAPVGFHGAWMETGGWAQAANRS